MPNVALLIALCVFAEPSRKAEPTFAEAVAMGLSACSTGREAEVQVGQPVALVGGLRVGAASSNDGGCPLALIAWGAADGWRSDLHTFSPADEVVFERIERAAGGTAAMAHFIRRTPVTLAPVRHCTLIEEPRRDPDAHLIVRFVVIVRPLPDAMEVIRIVTGISLERAGMRGPSAIMEQWTRSLKVTRRGIELRRGRGNVAFFRDLGRFAWADLEAVISREERLMNQSLRVTIDRAVGECEQTNRLSPFLEGYLEPLMNSLSDGWQRVAR